MADNRTDRLQACLICLHQVMERFPFSPPWEALRVAIEAELDTCEVAVARTAPEPRQVCVCCRIRPVTLKCGFCAQCEAIYQSLPARIVDGRCGCGHPARETHVYLRRSDDGDMMFCSPDCCAADYAEVMGIFLDIWHGKVEHA